MMRIKGLITLIISLFFAIFLVNLVHADSYTDLYNSYVYPRAQYNINLQAPYAASKEVQETVDPLTGNLQIIQTDLSLKGKNGLDVNITRIYNSSQANLKKPAVSKDYYGNTVEGASDNKNYGYSTYLGNIWELDLPFIETIGGYKYLHLGTAGTYDLDNNYDNFRCTDYLPNPRDYEYCFIENKKVNIYYIVAMKDTGINLFFDGNGCLRVKRDRFGNEIKYVYDGPSGWISKIIDSMQREILFTYSGTPGVSDKIVISVNDPNNTTAIKQIEYDFSYISFDVIFRDKTIIQDQAKVLSKVINSENRETKFEYSLDKYKLSFLSKSSAYYNGPNSIFNTNANLTKIILPTGGESRYKYSVYMKNLGNSGVTEFFKVTNKVDVKKDGNIFDCKKFNYRYSGSLEYDGYPSYTQEPQAGSIYSTLTQIIDEKNDVSQFNEIYTYSSFDVVNGTQGMRSLMLCSSNKSEGSNSKVENTFTYNIHGFPRKKIMKSYNRSTGNCSVKVEDFIHDDYGNILKYWGPQAQRDSNYNLIYPNTDGHLTSYMYEYRQDNSEDITSKFSSTYVIPTGKIYKKDDLTTVKEEYTTEKIFSCPSPYGSTSTCSVYAPRWKKVYENNVLKSQSWYVYDSYGNVIEERNYFDDWTNYILTKYSFDDNDAVRSGKFNGSYLTKKSVYDVKDTDNNLIGTVSENYKYDWFGNLIEKDDPKGNPTTYQYDKLGRVLKETHLDNTFKQNVYNDSENTIVVTDEKNNSKKYGYDEFGNLIYEQNLNNGEYINHYEYDAKARISGEYNYNKTSTEYYYNSDGRSNKKESKEQYVWFDNSLPPGATLTTNNDTWNWSYQGVGGVPHYNVSDNYTGLHSHSFENVSRKMKINAGDYIFVNVYLPSSALPLEIMLQWKENGSWEHRAYWGTNSISLGTDGTASRKYIGSLPESNKWTTLVIPASAVGLEGKNVDGMSFSLYNGQVYWDKVGIYRGSNSSKILACETYSYDDANVLNGITYSKFTKVVQGDAISPSITTNMYFNSCNQLEKQEQTHVENGVAKAYTTTFKYDYLGNKTEEKSARGYDESWAQAYTSKTDYNFAGKPVKVYNITGDYTTTTYDSLGRVSSVTDIKGNKTNPV